MKTKKRFLAVVLAAALLVAGLTGCKDALRGVAQKISGSSGEVQEEDTTRWADATADPLIIQGIADASAKFDTAMVDGTCTPCSTASGAARPTILRHPPAR